MLVWIETVTGVTYVFRPGEIQDFIKGPPAVILADGVTLFEADMVIGRDENAYSIGLCLG
jgi:hypothetical protein